MEDVDWNHSFHINPYTLLVPNNISTGSNQHLLFDFKNNTYPVTINTTNKTGYFNDNKTKIINIIDISDVIFQAKEPSLQSMVIIEKNKNSFEFDVHYFTRNQKELLLDPKISTFLVYATLPDKENCLHSLLRCKLYKLIKKKQKQ